MTTIDNNVYRSCAKNRTGSVSLGLALGIALLAAATAAYAFYLLPRYGGLTPYMTGGKMAGSMIGQTEGNLERLKAALALYYSDRGGKYPASLAELWEKQYLTDTMPREDIFIEESGNKFSRAHWYRDADKVKVFGSRAEADDSGGWGYVADPDSPEWGTVFLNCTHTHFKKGVPWNLSSLPAAPPPPQDRFQSAGGQ